jgi:hypothetical protein
MSGAICGTGEKKTPDVAFAHPGYATVVASDKL